MNLNFTSAHAKVFESVRTARFRALADYKMGGDEYRERCRYADGDQEYCDLVAVALWIQAPWGTISPLCDRHLGAWLDDCYSDIKHDPEPPVVVPLRRSH